jgi:hypothetical protein
MIGDVVILPHAALVQIPVANVRYRTCDKGMGGDGIMIWWIIGIGAALLSVLGARAAVNHMAAPDVGDFE